MTTSRVLASYVPRLVEDAHRAGLPARQLLPAGTLVSADISGFTALSERLAGYGPEGAEELTELLNGCFSEMIAACEARLGDVVKFGGDALLVLFVGDGHERRAVEAMVEMRAIVSRPWSTSSVRRVRLGISQGAHSGRFGFSIVDGGHLELLVGGPGVSAAVRCEAQAGRGEILVTAATAAALPDEWLDAPLADGSRAVRRRMRARAAVPAVAAREESGGDGLDRYLAASLVDQITAGTPGEHRQVAVAFVHVGGIDDLVERTDAATTHAACEEVAVHLREVLRHHPVHLLASDAYVNGVKLILTAGAPVSTDADEDHLLLAVHELVSSAGPLPLRAGVNRGRVFVGDLGGPTRRTFTVMGDAVNLAARLMQGAAPGEIVVSAAVLDRSSTSFATRWLEPFTVKGQAALVHAAVLGDPLEPDVPGARSTVPFVGRASEVDRLRELASDAVAGRGSAVEVIGEAGIGKSRLVDEALRATPGLEVLTLRGGHYGRSTPYFVVRRLLRQAIGRPHSSDAADIGAALTAWVSRNRPELTPWLPLVAIAAGADVDPTPEVDALADEFRRDRLLAVVAGAIEAMHTSPVALVAEDVQLFDDPSLDVLRALAQRAVDGARLVVFTHRGQRDLDLSAVARHDALRLEPLAPDEAGELVAAVRRADTSTPSRSADLTGLVGRAGGNPLFLLELANAAVDDTGALPESIESIVTTRIDTLPARDRLLLRDAAVAGQVVDRDLLAEAFDAPELDDPRRWRSLVGFVERRSDGRYAFRHALYRDVAYAGLSFRRRRHVHQTLGEVIERRAAGRTDDTAALLSAHFDQSRDRPRAWRYAVQAGDLARDGYANVEAATLYERALGNAGHDHAKAAEVGRVSEALGDVLQLGGRPDAAVGAYQRSRSQGAVAVLDEVRLLRKIGRVREREGRLSQALRWYGRASRALDGVRAGRARSLEEAEIALQRAGALNRQGRSRESAESAEVALVAAERAGDRLCLARTYNILEVAYSVLGRPEARECAMKALAMYEGSGDLVGEANVLNNLGVQAYYRGDWREAAERYARSRELRQRAGDVIGEAMTANNVAEILSLQGRLAAARLLFDHACAAWTAAGYPFGVAYATANAAMVVARDGAGAEGLAMLASARAEAERLGASAIILEMDVRRVECLLLADEPAAALDAATALRARLAGEHEGDDELLTQLVALAAIASLRVGEVDSAEAAAAEALERARVESNHYLVAIALLVGAALDERAGRDATATRREALRLLEHLDVAGVPPVAHPLAAPFP